MLLFGHGPKEKWHAELERMSRAALEELALKLVSRIWILGGDVSSETLEESIADAKKLGKWEADHRRHLRFMADPIGEVGRMNKRSRAAKKAARRRKQQKRRQHA